jgi:hypothetical protein
MSDFGRPSAYKPENPEIARQCCAAGGTNQSLAERLGVCRRTIDNWIASIPDFRDAVMDGREQADGAVVSALFARATGFKQKTIKTFLYRGQPVYADHVVDHPPDTHACIFWLRNRLPEEWLEKAKASDPGLTFDDLEEASRRVAERNAAK